MIFKRGNFIGGMNLQFEPTRIGDTEYPLLVNGRNREGTIRPIKGPLQQANVPVGKFQGLYAASQYLLLLCDGRAYLRDVTQGSGFNVVQNVVLNANADTVWAELVPGSTLNFARIAAGETTASTGVALSGAISQSLASVVLQDGVSQPCIIESNGIGRIASDYAKWSKDSREYVPIGRNMLYSDGVLYVVSADGTQIYRSIKGRPLDFMINITGSDGDKGGDASTVSHAVGYEAISCMAPLNSPDYAFFVATKRNATKVIPDNTRPIFDQPQFINSTLMPTGPVNQFSFTESNGDNLFINSRGVRSFNAAVNMRTRGDNAPFSKRVSSLFRGLIQSGTCIAKFNDYVHFAVNTIHGSGVLIYDETLQVFVALDIYPGVAAIKQFAVVTVDNTDRLFFITTDNKLYEAYAGATATMQFYLGEFCPDDPGRDMQPNKLWLGLINAREAGTIRVTPYTDRKAVTGLAATKAFEQRMTEATPAPVPFNGSNADFQPFDFDLGRCEYCWKFGVLVEVTGDAEITHIGLETLDRKAHSHAKAETRDYYSRM